MNSCLNILWVLKWTNKSVPWLCFICTLCIIVCRCKDLVSVCYMQHVLKSSGDRWEWALALISSLFYGYQKCYVSCTRAQFSPERFCSVNKEKPLSMYSVRCLWKEVCNLQKMLPVHIRSLLFLYLFNDFKPSKIIIFLIYIYNVNICRVSGVHNW